MASAHERPIMFALSNPNDKVWVPVVRRGVCSWVEFSYHFMIVVHYFYVE